MQLYCQKRYNLASKFYKSINSQALEIAIAEPTKECSQSTTKKLMQKVKIAHN